MIKSVTIISLVLVLALVLTACGGPIKSEPVKEVFTGTSEETLEDFLGAMGLDIMSFTNPVTAENVTGVLGLSTADFDKYIVNATSSVAAIMTHAHLVSAIACVNPADAKTVKDLIAKGFDPARWICVFPEECFVVEVGSYVFLVASTAENAEMAKNALNTLAGDAVGEYNVFFTGAASGGGTAVGGMPVTPVAGDDTTAGNDGAIKLS